VATIFASPAAAQPPAITPTPPLAAGQRLQIANTGGDGANLRRDPGQSGEKIKTVPEGSLVEIVGPDRNVDGTVWRNVRDLQGDVGWVAGGFLALEGSVPIIVAPAGGSTPSAATGSTPAAPRPTTAVAPSGATRGQVGNTGGQGANIRSEPGSGGRVLKTLAEGATIEVLGPEREVDGQIWRQVRDSSGVTGWIIRGAVAPAGSVATPVPNATRAPSTGSTPSAGSTPAPAIKPSTGTSGGPTATTGPTRAPGDLPIIIQPATPRPSSGNATPRPTPQGSSSNPTRTPTKTSN
jgi:SH3-like domain-containing protein